MVIDTLENIYQNIPSTFYDKEQKDYEILTAEISKATFGITPSDYKKVKGLIPQKKASSPRWRCGSGC